MDPDYFEQEKLRENQEIIRAWFEGMVTEPLPRPAQPNNLNRVLMKPQPLIELDQAVSDYKGQWGKFVCGKGMGEPFLNQPKSAVGVQKENGIWYWLLND